MMKKIGLLVIGLLVIVVSGLQSCSNDDKDLQLMSKLVGCWQLTHQEYNYNDGDVDVIESHNTYWVEISQDGSWVNYINTGEGSTAVTKEKSYRMTIDDGKIVFLNQVDANGANVVLEIRQISNSTAVLVRTYHADSFSFRQVYTYSRVDKIPETYSPEPSGPTLWTE